MTSAFPESSASASKSGSQFCNECAAEAGRAGDTSVCVFRLALCDLAGSERCSRTHNTGKRLKEAGNINSSLLTLGKCIHAMRLNQNAK